MADDQLAVAPAPEAPAAPTPANPATPVAGDAKPEESTLLGADPKTPDPNAPKATETPVAKAPETYEFKLPQGLTLDKTMADEFTPLFKELDLSQEQAQKIVDKYVPTMAKMREAQRDETLKSYNEMTEGWKNETVKELGADYKQKLGPAAKLIDASPYAKEFRELMDETKIGEHPVMNKMMIWIGSKLGQDPFVEPNKQSTGNPMETSLYTHPSSVASMTKK